MCVCVCVYVCVCCGGLLGAISSENMMRCVLGMIAAVMI